MYSKINTSDFTHISDQHVNEWADFWSCSNYTVINTVVIRQKTWQLPNANVLVNHEMWLHLRSHFGDLIPREWMVYRMLWIYKLAYKSCKKWLNRPGSVLSNQNCHCVTFNNVFVNRKTICASIKHTMVVTDLLYLAQYNINFY